MIDEARKIIKSYDNQLYGVFHLELLKSDNKIYPVELNLRVGGAESLYMVNRAYNIDLSKYIFEL